MAHRAWFLGIIVALAVAGVAVADGPIAPGGPNLKTTLEKGLKARRPVEFEFIQLVVDKVNHHELPLAVVEKSFLWARHKRPYPFPFFQQALRVQAKDLGIVL